MRFIQDADINLYFMIVTPRNRPEYNHDYGVNANVHIATYGTNLVPEVGDIITGDYGYKSQRGEVVAVRQTGQGSGNWAAYDVDLAEIKEES